MNSSKKRQDLSKCVVLIIICTSCRSKTRCQSHQPKVGWRESGLCCPSEVAPGGNSEPSGILICIPGGVAKLPRLACLTAPPGRSRPTGRKKHKNRSDALGQDVNRGRSLSDSSSLLSSGFRKSAGPSAAINRWGRDSPPPVDRGWAWVFQGQPREAGGGAPHFPGWTMDSFHHIINLTPIILSPKDHMPGATRQEMTG